MKGIASFLKSIFLFKPEEPKKPFVLDDFEHRDGEDASDRTGDEGAGASLNRDEKEEKEKERKDEESIKNERKIRMVKPISVNSSEAVDNREESDDGKDEVSGSLTTSLEVMKKRYSADINGDFKIREFKVRVKDKAYPAFICFFDGLVDSMVINSNILVPLMTLSVMPMDTEDRSVKDIIFSHLIPQNQIKMCKTYQEVVDEINFGGVGIFIDSLDAAFAADVKDGSTEPLKSRHQN